MTNSDCPSVLVISSRKDGHIPLVADQLDAHGANWVRVNTEDFARNASIQIDPCSGEGVLALADSGKSLSLSSVRAVWYRKPDPLNLDHFQLETPGLDYVEAEFREIIDGIYALLTSPQVFWINNPLTTRLSHRKLLQL